jgi:hypothetical protein
MISTPLAASTSIVRAQAGTESTWVSVPRKQAINGLRLAVITNSLADSQNMPFVESAFKGGPMMKPEVPNATCCSGNKESGTSM